jgi:transposase-like protein
METSTPDFFHPPKACPRCGCKTVYKIKKRDSFVCRDCHRHFSFLYGTSLAGSKFSRDELNRAIAIFIQLKGRLSAKSLERILHCTYKSAWKLKTKIKQFLANESEGLQRPM